MANLILELPIKEFEQLKEEANRLGKSPQDLVKEWIVQHLGTPSLGRLEEKERVKEALRNAGLLSQLGNNLQKLADSSISLAEIQAALGRVAQPTLSEIVIEQREPNF
jgi:hypothetical protein